MLVSLPISRLGFLLEIPPDRSPVFTTCREIVSWIDLAILAGGSLLGFVAFVRGLPDLVRCTNDLESGQESDQG